MNKHIKQYGSTKELMQSSIPVLKHIILHTVTLRDAWDASADWKQLKALTRAVAAYIIADVRDGVANNDVDKREQTHALRKLNYKHCKISAREYLWISCRRHDKLWLINSSN
jgi:hypothetical protein